MLGPRAFVRLSGLALGVVVFAACGRSATAPELRSARIDVAAQARYPISSTVDPAPPAGPDSLLARVGPTSDRATSQAHRRGRSKYSVIFF